MLGLEGLKIQAWLIVVHRTPVLQQVAGARNSDDSRGSLAGPASKWLDYLHPNDRDRFRAALDALVSERRGRLIETFRLRGQDGHYIWFVLRARPVVGSDGEVLRCVGTMLDVGDRAEFDSETLEFRERVT